MALCVLSAVFYSFFFVTFALSNSPNGRILKETLLPEHWRISNTLGLFLAFVIPILGLFLMYLCLLGLVRLSNVGPVSLTWILGFSLAYILILVLLPPFMSTDVFLYPLQGKTINFYHLNPYITPPIELGPEPWLAYIEPRTILPQGSFSPYGPLWVGIEFLVALLFSQNIFTQIVVFKLIAILFNLANIVVIYRILKQLIPGQELIGVVFYAFNPLVLFETAGMGHNDTVMLFFVLASIALFQGRRYVWSATTLVAAGLIKYTALILVPAFLLLMYRESRISRWVYMRMALAGGALVLR